MVRRRIRPGGTGQSEPWHEEGRTNQEGDGQACSMYGRYEK